MTVADISMPFGAYGDWFDEAEQTPSPPPHRDEDEEEDDGDPLILTSPPPYLWATGDIAERYQVTREVVQGWLTTGKLPKPWRSKGKSGSKITLYAPEQVLARLSRHGIVPPEPL
jgi:hypothetical protein